MTTWALWVFIAVGLSVWVARDIRTSRRGDFQLETRLDRMLPWLNHPEIESPGQAAKTRALIYFGPVVLTSMLLSAFTATHPLGIVVLLVGGIAAGALLGREVRQHRRYPWNRSARRSRSRT